MIGSTAGRWPRHPVRQIPREAVGVVKGGRMQRTGVLFPILGPSTWRLRSAIEQVNINMR